MKINYLEIVTTRYNDQEGKSSSREVLKRVSIEKRAEAEAWLENWKDEVSKKDTWWMTWKEDWEKYPSEKWWQRNPNSKPVGWIEEKTIEIEENL